ncbi:hypothetical protein B0H10DRAFT_2202647 [Mycena sp. CBHHK59/15]|nr:hypothetical protein B0H10DRAFT_2202647 [Mycena sp. CBHHK59/15]
MSDTFVEPNIDPALLAMDPASQMLQKMCAKRASASAPGTPPPRDDDATAGGNNRMDQDLPPGPSSFTPGPSLFALAPSSLATSGTWSNTRLNSVTSRQWNLTDSFRQVLTPLRSAEERNTVLFAHVLALRDITRMNERPDKWVISPDLLKKINMYCEVFMIMPVLTAYRGLKLNEHILACTNAMWLPPNSEPLKVEVVLAKIGKQVTHIRNDTKAADRLRCVKQSLKRGSDLENIANLAAKVIQGTKIKATLQLYIRLATIHFVMVNYPVFVGTDAFWLKVDDVLDKNSKQSATQAELDVLYNCYYDDDMAEYGDPAKTAHQTVESNETDMTSWQGVMRKHSANVLPNPNLEKLLLQALAAVVTVQSTLKPKHPTEEEPETAE